MPPDPADVGSIKQQLEAEQAYQDGAGIVPLLPTIRNPTLAVTATNDMTNPASNEARPSLPHHGVYPNPKPCACCLPRCTCWQQLDRSMPGGDSQTPAALLLRFPSRRQCPSCLEALCYPSWRSCCMRSLHLLQ